MSLNGGGHFCLAYRFLSGPANRTVPQRYRWPQKAPIRGVDLCCDSDNTTIVPTTMLVFYQRRECEFQKRNVNEESYLMHSGQGKKYRIKFYFRIGLFSLLFLLQRRGENFNNCQGFQLLDYRREIQSRTIILS